MSVDISLRLAARGQNEHTQADDMYNIPKSDQLSPIERWPSHRHLAQRLWINVKFISGWSCQGGRGGRSLAALDYSSFGDRLTTASNESKTCRLSLSNLSFLWA
jgi:hypothetical protein